MADLKRGLFITFEGIDGCGKTTQLNLLSDYLENKKYQTIKTLEPGGSEIGKKLRQILLHYNGFVSNRAEMFLYLADRAQHIDEIVLKNIEKGIMVLCDRHTDSTLAYQGYARGGNLAQIELLNNIATSDHNPDLTFLFDVDVETAQKRVGDTKDRMESEKIDFHNKVREGYLELAKKYPDRIKIINAAKTPEQVFLDVKEIINGLL